MIDVPVRVKDALRDGSLPKEYQITVYKTDGETVDFVLDNSSLVSESVKIDERMCSDETLKFGLTEGTSIEFQYFNAANIMGRQIRVVLYVEYGAAEPYAIPMGRFEVKECSRQASTGIIKCSAYNKLMSDYLNMKAYDILKDYYSENAVFTLYDIRQVMLAEYEMFEEPKDYLPTNWGVKKEKEHWYDDYGEAIFRCAPNMSLQSRWGINCDCIINYYEIYGTETQTGNLTSKYITCERSYWYVDLDPNELYKLDSEEGQSFIELEEIVFNDIKEEVYKAFQWSVEPIPDAQTFMDKMVTSKYARQDNSKTLYPSFLAYKGWHSWCSVVLTYQDGTREYYTTIGKKYGLSEVVGTFRDIYGKTIRNCTKIEFNIPRYFGGWWGEAHSKVYMLVQKPEITPVHNTFYEYKYFRNSLNADPVKGYKRVLWWGAEGGQKTIQETNEGTIVKVYKLELSKADAQEFTLATLGEMTLRDAVQSSYELSGLFGRLDRTGDKFMGISLNNKRLYPTTLYPDDVLYPTDTNADGQAERANRAMYSKLWADEGNVRSFRYLIITYKGVETDESGNLQEVEKTLQRTIDENGTDNYNMSDNWLFRNLVWDAETVGEYADAMVAKMRNVTWFPFEMWCAGLPYIETGDEVEINTDYKAYISYVLRRTLSGIQNLQDEMINGTLDIF